MNVDGAETGRRSRPWFAGGAIATVVAPWSWFVVRDLSDWTDIVAGGLPTVYAAYLVVVGLAWFPRRLGHFAAGACSTVAAAAVAIVLPWAPLRGLEAPVGGTRILAANVTHPQGMDAIATVAALVETEPDVLVVSETSGDVRQLLSQRYDYAIFTDRILGTVADGQSVGVFSDRPIEQLPPEIDRTTRGLRIRVPAADDFVLYANHLPPLRMQTNQGGVSPVDQRAISAELVESARSETLPVVLAGDLNTPDRGRSFRAYGEAFIDAGRASFVGPTSRRPDVAWLGLLLRIDHILIPPTWCAEASGQIELPASDHVGVMATVGACPE